jgi:ribosomal protein S18 acetylase RimI-like enzyme
MFPLDFARSLRDNDRMSDPIVLRPATAADAAVLAATIAAAFEQYRDKLLPESGAVRETEAGIAAELAKGASAIVAERNGAVAGCVMTKPREGDLYFGRLSVLPAARGLGLARRLVAAVEDDARARGLPGVRLGVRIALPANQELFHSLGYREISREAHPGFAQPTSINMRKALIQASDA